MPSRVYGDDFSEANEDDYPDLPSGLKEDEASRYLLALTFPEASADQIATGVKVLHETTLADIRAGKELSQSAVDEATEQFGEIFPVADHRSRFGRIAVGAVATAVVGDALRHLSIRSRRR